MNIFDSLSHPTLTGKWVSKKHDSCFKTLQEKMQNTSVKWACAVGLDGIENYSHKSFYDICKKYKNLFPIAGFNPCITNHLPELRKIKKIGYYGIKIHPRFSNLAYTDPAIDITLKICGSLDIPVFFCTYSFCDTEKMAINSFNNLVGLLSKNTNTKVILVHGGAVEVLKYMEFVRFNPNLLLDLSLTLFKYKGSSIDLDLKFLFESFDRRICIGTDHPEYTPKDLENRFNELSSGLTKEKKENIAFRNISTFLSIQL